MVPMGKCTCMLKRKFCVASFWFLSIVILFVFVFFSFTAHILYILGQILGYFREHGPRLFTVLLYTLFYIIMHVIYISEYFFFYTTVYHYLPQDCSPHCVKRLAEVNESTNKCFPKDWSKHKWSVVECPFRKALWLKDINAISLLKNVNRSWRMEVNNFPKQLINVITLKLSRSKLLPLFLYRG
jgi:hypothetical protein